MNSLRNKIILSYGIAISTLLLMTVLMYTDLKYLQAQIIEGENIRNLQSLTQQLLSQEENLLIYNTVNANFLLQEQIDQIQLSYRKYHSALQDLVETGELDKLAKSLQNYSHLLDQLLEADKAQAENIQLTLRQTSESISNSITQLGQSHYLLLSDVTDVVSWTLGLALILVTIIGFASAVFVIRHVIKPIRTLELQLDAVADGDMHKLTLASNDAEVQSFVQHFNTMLDRLREQQSQLRHHEKAAALGVLVSGVAHELNNPLSNISTSVQLLLEDEDTRPELRQQWLAHIDSETERARRIVRRLLDSVRQPSQDVQHITAAELVGSATMLIHRQLSHDILIDIEDVSDSVIRVNRERFQQVFINLIRNAVDAGAKNIWIFGDVTTWEDSKPDDIELVEGEVASISNADKLMLFTVADNGPGIPEKNLPQLFTPFFTTKTSGEGTGLGLYLVHEIIEEHDGCITVENRADGGSQFLIWLPLTEEE